MKLSGRKPSKARLRNVADPPPGLECIQLECDDLLHQARFEMDKILLSDVHDQLASNQHFFTWCLKIPIF